MRQAAQLLWALIAASATPAAVLTGPDDIAAYRFGVGGANIDHPAGPALAFSRAIISSSSRGP